jgi:hypothetical protein
MSSYLGLVAPNQETYVNRTAYSKHPEPDLLRRFALGQLGSEAMRRVERHVRYCEVCLRAALEAPGDRLVSLLRRTAPGPDVGPAGGYSPSSSTS